MGQSKSKKDIAKSLKHQVEFSWWGLHKYVAVAFVMNAAVAVAWADTGEYTIGVVGGSVNAALERLKSICRDQLADESRPEWDRWRITRSQFRDAFTGVSQHLCPIPTRVALPFVAVRK